MNIAADIQHLQFTAEIWMTEATPPLPTKKYRVQVMTNYEFLFLDMKMSWSLEGYLQFGVFSKK